MSTQTQTHPRAWLFLAGFLILVIGMGGIIGANNLPDAWYQELAKPPFNPPNWIFGPVWTVLYVFIAVAGWRIFMRAPNSAAMKIWGAQMLLNWAWTPVWFTFHLLWPAFAIIATIFALIVAFILTARPIDRVSAWLFVPYAVWVGFASVLNLWIAAVN
jgi:translocator protein